MKGKVESGQLCTVEPVDAATIKVGDIVLCKVNGKQYLHLVKAIQGKRFQIGNNRGRINGWVGENPKGYTTKTTFHAWIDGGYFKKTGGLKVEALTGKIHPAEKIANANDPEGVFRDVVAYLVDQNKLVEPLYEMEKDGLLTGDGEKGQQGRAFLEGQLVKAGQMLGNIWLTAWLDAPDDTYLQKQLQQRNAAAPPESK